MPGTGKGFLANAYGHLWGPHYTTVTHREHVAGRFNNHLFAQRFVFIDEGVFGGNKKDVGILKTRVTENYVMFEAKGVDPIKVRNRMIFMIASNEEYVIPADIADRRWQMFDVGSKHREDREYFKAISDQLRAGGYQAFMHHLLERDIEAGRLPNPIKLGRRCYFRETEIDEAMSRVEFGEF